MSQRNNYRGQEGQDDEYEEDVNPPNILDQQRDENVNKMSYFLDDFLRTMVFPNIKDFIYSEYNDDVSLDKLSEIVYKKRLLRNNPDPTKRKPKEIDEINGCQYIIDRSKIRKGSKCGNPREHGSYFCKYCKEKTSFPLKAKKLAEELGLSFYEVAGCEEYDLPDKKRKENIIKSSTGRGRGSVRGRGSGRGGRGEQISKDEVVITTDENIGLNLIDIPGLKNIVSDTAYNIIFYFEGVEDEDNLPIAFGQWDENGKIVPMTASTKTIAKQVSKIGNYKDYNKDIGKYSVDYQGKSESSESSEDEKSNSDDDDIREEKKRVVFLEEEEPKKEIQKKRIIKIKK